VQNQKKGGVLLSQGVGTGKKEEETTRGLHKLKEERGKNEKHTWYWRGKPGGDFKNKHRRNRGEKENALHWMGELVIKSIKVGCQYMLGPEKQ